MTAIDVKKELDALSERIRDQFGDVRGQFADIGERFVQVDMRFDRLETELKDLRQEMQREGATTRRHFDIVAEDLRSDMRLLHEHNAAVLAKIDAHVVQNAREHAIFERRFLEQGARLDRLDRR